MWEPPLMATQLTLGNFCHLTFHARQVEYLASLSFSLMKWRIFEEEVHALKD